MSTKTIEQRAQDFYDAVFDDGLVHLMDVAEGDKRPNRREREEGVYSEDDARQRIEESCYGIEARVVHHVTLAGGGPAARLEVYADEDGEVLAASLQFCDWFEPWTDVPKQDRELVERYARLVGYYGDGPDGRTCACR